MDQFLEMRERLDAASLGSNRNMNKPVYLDWAMQKQTKAESIPSIVSTGPLIPAVNVQRDDELRELELEDGLGELGVGLELGMGDHGLQDLSKGPPELGSGPVPLL